MLTSPLGTILHLLLRNDLGWSLLSEEEKELVKKANAGFNTLRPDYADPARYQGGRSYDSAEDRTKSPRGLVLRDFLEKYRPRTVLEVGPGSGYHTRQLVEFPTIERYLAVDINDHFLEFIGRRLSSLAKPGFEAAFFCADIVGLEAEIRAEAIILLSAVHHIPDRLELLEKLKGFLAPGGRILALDPAHGLPRVWRLTKKLYSQGYLKKAYRQNPANFATHQFCTLGEYRRLCRRIEGLSLEEAFTWGQARPFCWLPGVKRAQPYCRRGWLGWFASEIGVVLKRT